MSCCCHLMKLFIPRFIMILGIVVCGVRSSLAGPRIEVVGFSATFAMKQWMMSSTATYFARPLPGFLLKSMTPLLASLPCWCFSWSSRSLWQLGHFFTSRPESKRAPTRILLTSCGVDIFKVGCATEFQQYLLTTVLISLEQLIRFSTNVRRKRAESVLFEQAWTPCYVPSHK